MQLLAAGRALVRDLEEGAEHAALATMRAAAEEAALDGFQVGHGIGRLHASEIGAWRLRRQPRREWQVHRFRLFGGRGLQDRREPRDLALHQRGERLWP